LHSITTVTQQPTITGYDASSVANLLNIFHFLQTATLHTPERIKTGKVKENLHNPACPQNNYIFPNSPSALITTSSLSEG
jgi:hypothetical protein